MLTEIEKKECAIILEKLSTEEVLSLKDTITKRKIAVEARNEAVKAILLYSQSAVELLRRKKIRRDIIFQYLADCNIVVPPTSEKSELIRRTLKHWGLPIPSDSELMEIESGTNLAGASSLTGQLEIGAAASGHSSAQRQSLNITALDHHNTEQLPMGTSTLSYHNNAGQQQGTTFVNSYSIDRQPLHSTSSKSCITVMQAQCSATSGHHSAELQSLPTAEVPSRLNSNSSLNQDLGEQFAGWFYMQLNSLNPTQQVTGDFGPHHFWENCRLKLVSQTREIREELHEGSLLAANRLSALVREEMLLFNPNISAEGVKVQSDPHGLLIVMVCGTLHQYNNLLGVFRQSFGLVRSPTSENWKVKFSELHLVSGSERTVPRLTDFASS